jgi:hypothetical protein
MKKRMLIGTIALLAGTLFAADSTPKDDVAAAASKLADGGNYSWKATMDMGPNSQFTPGPTEGKTDKDGYIWISSTFNDNTAEGAKKGDKVAVKGEDGWQSASEVSGGGGGGGGGGGNPAAFMARRLQTLKPPAAEVQDLISKVKDITKDGDTYSGELTEEGAKALLTMGRRRGGGTPSATTEAKGSVKFWLKDGALTKYQSKVSGKREVNGEERQIERTTTVEIKDVGATKVSLPDEAKSKLS